MSMKCPNCYQEMPPPRINFLKRLFLVVVGKGDFRDFHPYHCPNCNRDWIWDALRYGFYTSEEYKELKIDGKL